LRQPATSERADRIYADDRLSTAADMDAWKLP
jgi:hypothetical protein